MGDSHMDTGFRNTSNVTEHDTPANDTEYYTYYFQPLTITEIVIDSVILVIGFPTICLAIYSLYRLVRSDMVVPIYIINLLIIDLLQIIVRPVFIFFNIYPKFRYADLTVKAMDFGSQIIFLGCLTASVWFMVSIALERYLVVAHPLWYRYRRSVRQATLISVGVWVMTLIFIAICILSLNWYVFNALIFVLPILLFLPFPLLVFFFVGTWRAIAGATSVRDAEKRRILGTLALVLGSYTVLFLPYCIVFISKFHKYFIPNTHIAYFLTKQMIKLNALVDPVLYILLRPDVRDTLGSVPCCQRLFTLTSCWTPRAEQQETEDAAAECLTESSV